MNRSEAARQRWTRIIREQRGSGLSVAAFCAERSMSASSLFAWKRKLGSGAGGTPPRGAPAFVEAKVRGVDDGHGGGVTVELAGGRRVIVGRGFDRGVLLEVIGVLESGAGGAP